MVAAFALIGLLAVAAADPAPLLIEPGADLYPDGDRTEMPEGDVPVTLSIDPAGRYRCMAAGGPALGPLRSRSCEILVQRNVFGPRSIDGNASPAEYSFLVRWRKMADNQQFGGAVPVGRDRWVTYADYPPIARHQMSTGRVAVAFEVNEHGSVEDCKVTRTNATLSLAGEMCPLLSRRAIFLPALDQDGRPRRSKGTFMTDWRWCERPPCAPPGVRR